MKWYYGYIARVDHPISSLLYILFICGLPPRFQRGLNLQATKEYCFKITRKESVLFKKKQLQKLQVDLSYAQLPKGPQDWCPSHLAQWIGLSFVSDFCFSLENFLRIQKCFGTYVLEDGTHQSDLVLFFPKHKHIRPTKRIGRPILYPLPVSVLCFSHGHRFPEATEIIKITIFTLIVF